MVAALGVAAAPPRTDPEIGARVAHEVRMYSWYSVWDNVEIRVANANVELLGVVNQPFKKTDLGRIVARVPGVAGVTNSLRVLPLSTMDDRLRLQVANAIYRQPALLRYAMTPLLPIHIIVENGRVTLEGVVSSAMDKQIAGMTASSAGLSFGQVVNNLRVENPAPKKS
jgi:osmotically-inducible protein OsmY